MQVNKKAKGTPITKISLMSYIFRSLYLMGFHSLYLHQNLVPTSAGITCKAQSRGFVRSP